MLQVMGFLLLGRVSICKRGVWTKSMKASGVGCEAAPTVFNMRGHLQNAIGHHAFMQPSIRI